MHSRCHHLGYLIAALATASAFASTCWAQEVASVDLTKVERRVELRRPKATSAVTAGSSITETTGCIDPSQKTGALQTAIVSLDRTHYQLGDEPTFDVKVENTGSTLIRIPFSPHLADLQPKDPAKKFSYSGLHIFLWIAGGEQWSTNTVSGAVLYGDDNHPGTMLSLRPGQWARIVGLGSKFALPGDQLNAELIRSHPPDHVYAEASLYREETLITPTQSATVEHEICVAHARGESVPIQLTIP
jgi:hypothetical protein